MAIPTPKILVMDRSLLDQTLGSPTLDNWISEKMLTKEISKGKTRGLGRKSEETDAVENRAECISKGGSGQKHEMLNEISIRVTLVK